MSLNRINYYAEGRGFEWSMAIGMVCCGFIFLIWPEALAQSAFTTLQMVFTSYSLAFAMILIGWSRIAALMLNGQPMFGARAGPYVRAIGGILSALFWVQFVFALIQISIVRGYPSPGIPFWIMFTLTELYSAYTTIKNRRG